MREARMPMGWLACATVACLATPLAAQETRPALAGQWQLNVKESENADTKFIIAPAAQQPGSPGPGGFGGQRTGGSPGGGWAGGPPRPSASPSPGATHAALAGAVPPEFREFLEPPKTLTITGSANELTLETGSGAGSKLAADGTARKEGAVSRIVRWEGSSLVVEAWSDKGVRLITRYNLMQGSPKLEVYSRLADGKGHALTLRRVYDGKPEDEASPPPTGPPPGAAS